MNALDQRSFIRLREQIEALDGSRGPRANLGLAAVRRRDVAGFGQLAPKSKKAAGDPPTQAEFDLLVDDVHTLMAALAKLSGQAVVR